MENNEMISLDTLCFFLLAIFNEADGRIGEGNLRLLLFQLWFLTMTSAYYGKNELTILPNV